MKRTFDIVISALALIALAPLLGIVALLVSFSGHGPVLFRQQRVGRANTTFTLLKFRSMVVGAEKLGSYQTSDDDIRITPIGRWIRRSSIDELPQLINVLRGDMSLVGPRPDVPEQRALYTNEEWALRHSVRPGLTGLAQARKRSSATTDERKALDLEYIRGHTFWLDVRILGMTLCQMVTKGGN